MSGEKMPLPNEIYASLESLSSVEEQVGAETYLGAETGQLGSPLIKKSAKIMIVDDEPICIKALRKYLRDSGYETFLTTNNSSEAFAMMKAASPDILLLDYMMPEVDGIEILKMRYHDAEIIHIPVLMLTASREGSVKVKALDLGATDFLSKPVDPNELLPRVRNALISKAHRDQLAKVNTLLEERVREQTKALRNAFEELKGLERLKNEFMTLVSHELRTPVAGIFGVLDLMQLGSWESEQDRNEVLRMARAQVLRLDRIVKDVQLFLDLTAGRISPSKQDIDLKTLVDTKAVEWAPLASEKGLSLNVVGEGALSVRTDPTLLAGGLDRLIENAIKFTERGEVRIGYREEAGKIVVEVQDTGCGISEEYKSRVLSPLTIAENINHHKEGRGLGLAILERQMHLVGGKVLFESQGKDQGSVFQLVLRGS